jgi:hypothetical protein
VPPAKGQFQIFYLSKADHLGISPISSLGMDCIHMLELKGQSNEGTGPRGKASRSSYVHASAHRELRSKAVEARAAIVDKMTVACLAD